MVFISAALPGVVFLVLLWVCEFSFQVPLQPKTHIWELWEPWEAWGSGLRGGPRPNPPGANLPPWGLGHHILPEAPCDPGSLNRPIFLYNVKDRQKSSCQETIWFFSCVYKLRNMRLTETQCFLLI